MCPEKVLYVRENYDMFGKFFGMSGMKHFATSFRQQFWEKILISG